jgi:hypothetical protein
MADEWYYIKEKKKLGPVSFAQLKEMVLHGHLGRADMVLPGGTAKWAAAESVDGLFPGVPDFAFAPPAPEAPPEPPPDLAVFADATDDRMRPHQGDLMVMLGASSIVAGVISLFIPCSYYLVAFSAVALGLGVPVAMKGKKDLRAMRANLVDPAGEGQTRTGWICGIVGASLGALSIAVMVLLQIVYVIMRYFAGASGT